MNQLIISRFKEKPKTKITWWAMGLGLGTLFLGPILGINAAVIVPIIAITLGESISRTVGIIIAILAFSLAVAALVAGFKAFNKGERSWVLWLGFVPSLFAGLILVLMIIGEFVAPH